VVCMVVVVTCNIIITTTIGAISAILDYSWHLCTSGKAPIVRERERERLWWLSDLSCEGSKSIVMVTLKRIDSWESTQGNSCTAWRPLLFKHSR
jgi:hypothetical protein